MIKRIINQNTSSTTDDAILELFSWLCMHAFLFWLIHQHAMNSLFNRSDLHRRIMFFCCSVGSSIFRFVNCEKPQVIFSFQFESEGTSDNLTFPAPRYHTLIIWNRMRCFLSGRRENKTDQLINLPIQDSRTF